MGTNIKYYRGNEVNEISIKKPEDLVENLIRSCSLSFLAGEEGCGKSLLAMNLAIAIATGKEKFLHYNIKKRGKVLYLNNELPFLEFVFRFRTMINNFDKSKSGLLNNFIFPDKFPPLDDYWKELTNKCESEMPILIILDCLYWAHDRKENDNSEMKTLMRQLIELRDAHKLAVLVIHHTKKGSKFNEMHNDNMRGASVFGSVADAVIQIRTSSKEESSRIIRPTKLRYSNDKIRRVHLLSLNVDTLWFKDEGETDEKEHIAAYTKRATAKERIDWSKILKPGESVQRKNIIERCSHLNFDDRTIDRLLKEAKGDKTLKVLKHGYYSL